MSLGWGAAPEVFQAVGTIARLLPATDEALNDLIFAARVRSQRTIPDGRRVTLLR